MREIKFKLWNVGLKSWGGIYLNENEDINEGIESYQKSGDIILQYTGLKDKNGKEIYEGDVISFKDLLDIVEREIAPIVWHENTLRLVPQDIEVNTRGGHYIHHWDSLMDIEVIGNIWENPELLDGKS
jgi:uncharacterized phage protein (TIGR01671 family)